MIDQFIKSDKPLMIPKNKIIECDNCKRLIKKELLNQVQVKDFFGYKTKNWCNDCIELHNKRQGEIYNDTR